MSDKTISIDAFLERFQAVKAMHNAGVMLHNMHVEEALFSLLKHYKDYLPKLDKDFHQTFRVQAVLPSKDLDHAVWNLIFCSEVFYVVIDQFIKELDLDFDQ